MRGPGIFLSILLFIAASRTHASAEEVSFDYLGLEVSGNLDIAPGKSLKNDGVVLIVHDTLGHDKMEPVAALQDSLKDVGVNSLAITLSLGLNKRKGMFPCNLEQDHRHEDALEEIVGWVRWLKEKGAPSITVAGLGRGANQVALYAINKLDKTVKRAVLISPLMQAPEKAETAYQSRFRRPLREELGKAEELVASDDGNQLLDVPGFLTCETAKVTAGAFANYYGANPKFLTTNLLQSIKIPVLVVTAELDPNAADIQSAQKEVTIPKTATIAIISGADADFRDGGDDLAKKIKDFLGRRSEG